MKDLPIWQENWGREFPELNMQDRKMHDWIMQDQKLGILVDWGRGWGRRWGSDFFLSEEPCINFILRTSLPVAPDTKQSFAARHSLQWLRACTYLFNNFRAHTVTQDTGAASFLPRCFDSWTLRKRSQVSCFATFGLNDRRIPIQYPSWSARGFKEAIEILI